MTVTKLEQWETHKRTHTHTQRHTLLLRTRTESTSCLSPALSFCSYAGRVVGSSFKAQKENPELTVRNTDPVLKGAKQRLEQLTQVHIYSKKQAWVMFSTFGQCDLETLAFKNAIKLERILNYLSLAKYRNLP